MHDETGHVVNDICIDSVFLYYFDLPISRFNTRIFNRSDPETKFLVCRVLISATHWSVGALSINVAHVENETQN